MNSSNRALTDADAQFVSAIPWLTEVQMYAENITNAGASAIAAMPNLEVLSLSNSRQITEAGLAPLAKTTRLTRVYFFNSRGWRTSRGHPELDYISLNGTGITNAGLQNLANCRDLNSINLAQTRITDDACDTLARLTTLSTLYLADTPLTDAGLVKLAANNQLYYLDISGCNVSDASAPVLARMPRLDSLRVGRTRMSPAAINGIKTALPSINIYQN